MTVGIYFFKFPNHFSTGGVTGIAIILGHYLPAVTPGSLVTIINIALLILGFAVLGKSFGIRTVYASLLMSGTLQLLEILCPMRAPMTTQPLVELLFAVGLPAVGSAILFNLDASSGGTDILAMILRKYTALNIGIALRSLRPNRSPSNTSSQKPFTAAQPVCRERASIRTKARWCC